jgi:hypothetical protein
MNRQQRVHVVARVGILAAEAPESLGVTRSMIPAIANRSVLSTAMLGIALAAMLAVHAQAAERVVLAEYFTNVY